MWWTSARRAAAREPAGSVARAHKASEAPRHHSGATSEAHRLAGGALGDTDDAGVAGEPPEGFQRKPRPILQVAHATGASGQRLRVDMHDEEWLCFLAAETTSEEGLRDKGERVGAATFPRQGEVVQHQIVVRGRGFRGNILAALHRERFRGNGDRTLDHQQAFGLLHRSHPHRALLGGQARAELERTVVVEAMTDRTLAC